MTQPIPFEIVEGPEGVIVGSNGSNRITLIDSTGRMFKRRAISGIAMKPPAEMLIPQLNAFATDLLANSEMPPQEARGRLIALAGMIPTAEPQRHEWLVVELDGVKVYTDGVNVVVTKQDLMP